jgi:hypothetical protein
MNEIIGRLRCKDALPRNNFVHQDWYGILPGFVEPTQTLVSATPIARKTVDKKAHVRRCRPCAQLNPRRAPTQECTQVSAVLVPDRSLNQNCTKMASAEEVQDRQAGGLGNAPRHLSCEPHLTVDRKRSADLLFPGPSGNSKRARRPRLPLLSPPYHVAQTYRECTVCCDR